MDQFKDNQTVNIVIVELDCAYDATARIPRIKYVNDSAGRLLGYSEAELLDKKLDIIYPPDKEKEPWLAAFSQLTGVAGNSFTGEIINKDKHRIRALISLTALPPQNSRQTGILVLLQEIGGGQAAEDAASEMGQCREVESALIESEERFRQMADMAGEWLWEQDPGGYYIYCSTAVNQILGYKPEQVVGKHYTEFLTAQDKADQQSYAASQHPFYSLINHYQHKDGHLVITESTGLPIIDGKGKLLKWRGVDRDITARKQFQDALIESEKHIRLIIESSLSAIVIMDSYGIITDWNYQAEKMFGWSRNEAIGCRLDEKIIPLRFRNAHRQGLQQFLHTGEGPILNRLIEQTAMRRDGSEFPVELSISPLRVGNAYSFSGFIHDISSRKAAEQQIRQAQVKLAIARSEINIARQIQASLSPSAPIKTGQFEVTGFCLPADQVGGDYFDYFLRDERCLDMVIADVSGHSIGPALFMVETRSAIRAQAKGRETPAEKLALLNHFLFEDLNNSDYFITLYYLRFDTATRQLTFANAGHPPPLVFNKLDRTCRRLNADGLILGVNKNERYEDRTLGLARGDLILLYTDGLTEAENSQGEFFGLERVCDAFMKHAEEAPQQIIAGLLQQLKSFCQTESFTDDITLMVFKSI